MDGEGLLVVVLFVCDGGCVVCWLILWVVLVGLVVRLLGCWE